MFNEKEKSSVWKNGPIGKLVNTSYSYSSMKFCRIIIAYKKATNKTNLTSKNYALGGGDTISWLQLV